MGFPWPSLVNSTNFIFSSFNQPAVSHFWFSCSRLKKSWIYVDAGNAVYLSEKANTDQMAKTLLRLSGLRGKKIAWIDLLK